MKTKVIQGHGYEPYPVLFDRTTLWETKAPLLKLIQVKGGDEEGGAAEPSNKPKKPKNKKAKAAAAEQ